MKKTSIVVNTTKKQIHMSVSGRMTAEDAALFVTEYKEKIGAIRGADYDLYVDCTTMQVLTPELTKSLEQVLLMYKQTGFKNIMIKTANSTLKLQLNRLI
ncbi:MAG: hypothetical protein UHX00_00035, partial [Caryophanon sp.]|nr:hypothetical protein [Caryophanon sp.]